MTGQSPIAWIEAHIVFSVLTYGILTVAAVAGVAVFLQERAMKGRRPTPLTALLPSVAAAEIMQVRLLLVTEVVLGLGLATGMALQYLETGTLVEFSHKDVAFDRRLLAYQCAFDCALPDRNARQARVSIRADRLFDDDPGLSGGEVRYRRANRSVTCKQSSCFALEWHYDAQIKCILNFA